LKNKRIVRWRMRRRIENGETVVVKSGKHKGVLKW